MVTDTEGYIQLIEYLTEHLSLFEPKAQTDNTDNESKDNKTLMELIEEELSDQIISVCNQNKELTFAHRNTIIREVDSIVYDLEEILSGVVNCKVTGEQKEFIEEFAVLIKNLFDTEIHTLVASPATGAEIG